MDKSQEFMVSVVVITYNHEKYIAKCINQILAQKTSFPIQIIIGDDCSTDANRRIIKQIADQNKDVLKDIKLLFYDKKLVAPNVSPGKLNFMTCLEATEGKYIALCDGDDYWESSSKLQKQIDFLEQEPSYAGTYHDTIMMINGEVTGKKYRPSLKTTMDTKDTFSETCPFHPSSFVFRKKALNLPDWFRIIPSGDMALFSIISKTGKLKYISEISSVYRKHESGITNAPINIGKSYHQERISLMEHLDAYHEYAYTQKAKEVIDYHKNELKKYRFLYRLKNKISRVLNKK